MRSTIRFILVAALGAASVSAETAYRIDIGRTDQPLLKTGYTALTTQFSSAGGSVTIDGDLFQVAGNLGSRLRTVGGLGGGAPDNLTADFAFANTGMITITLGSAGGLEHLGDQRLLLGLQYRVRFQSARRHHRRRHRNDL